MYISQRFGLILGHCAIVLALHAQNDQAVCAGPPVPSRLPVRIGERYGFIDRAGNLVIKPQFESVRPFSEGRAFVWLGGTRHAYVDENGEIVAETGYLFADENADFHEGLAVTCAEDGCGYLDRDGRIAIPRRFKAAEVTSASTKRFSDGLAAVLIDDKWGYINGAGQVIIAPQFDEANEFSEGLAAVQIGSDYGFIDKAGSIVIKPQYDLATRFSEGFARVHVGRDRTAASAPDGGWSKGAWGFVNKRGQFSIPANFDWVDDFRCGIAVARTTEKKFGVVGRNGQWVVPPGDFRAGYFTDGLLAVKNGDKSYGYISRSGSLVIPYQFTSAGPFLGGLARVEIQRVEAYIDTAGHFVWRFPSDQQILDTIQGSTWAWSVGSVEIHVDLPNVWASRVMLPTCGGPSHEPRLCGEFTTLEQQSGSGWQVAKLKPSCCGVVGGYPAVEYFTRMYIPPGDQAYAVYSFDPRRLQLEKGQRLRLVVRVFENGESPAFRTEKNRIILSEEIDLPMPPEW